MTEQTAIVLKTRWPVLSLVFIFVFSTFVTIDGVTTLLPPWGEHAFPVLPGAHEVQVSLGRSIGGRRPMSEAEINVEVGQEKRVRLLYRVPFLYLYQDGTLEIVQ